MAILPRAGVFERGSEEYENYRTAYVNANVPRVYPNEIHTPEDLAGVIAAVKRAAETRMPIGVRSGGHLFACVSLRNGGILIDMSLVNRRVKYDPQTQLVDFGPAVRVREAVTELQQHKRFFPTGHAPSVALGGFCLAGGQGWFMRGWGATIDQWVVKMEIVTVTGEVVIADREHNEDLFWAARGSGQWFFGVVTRIWGRTMPSMQLFHRSLLFRVESSFESLLSYAFEKNRRTPKYGTETAIVTFYPEKYIPTESTDTPNSGLMMAVETIAYTGTLEEAQTLLSAWTTVAESLKHLVIQDVPVRPTTWDDLFAAQDALVPSGNGERWICDSILNDPDVAEDELLRRIKPAMCDLPTRTSCGCIYIGDTYPDERNAVFSLPQQYYISTFVGSSDAALDGPLRKWTQDVYKEASKAACGMYIADYDESSRRSRVFTPTALMRFLEVKKKYDPYGQFLVSNNAE